MLMFEAVLLVVCKSNTGRNCRGNEVYILEDRPMPI